MSLIGFRQGGRVAYLVGRDYDREALAAGLHQLGWQTLTVGRDAVLPSPSARHPVFGDVPATRRYLGDRPHSPPDYPDCAREFLRREVWRGTLGEAFSLRRPIFVKSVASKALSGMVLDAERDPDQGYLLETRDPDMPCWLAEPTRMRNEWRILSIRGRIVGWTPNPYRCRTWEPPSHKVAADIARRLWEGMPAFPATSFDIAIGPGDHTLLVEVNGALALGRYGLPLVPYAKTALTAWKAVFASAGGATP